MNRFPYENDDTFLSCATSPIALTGRRAQASVSSIVGRIRKNGDDPNAVLPVQAREQRRREARATAKRRADGQRAWRRQELARERAANDLAQLLNIVDGKVPARSEVIERANRKINQTVKEFQATEAGKDLAYEEVEARLREVAKRAPIVTPVDTRSARSKARRSAARKAAVA